MSNEVNNSYSDVEINYMALNYGREVGRAQRKAAEVVTLLRFIKDELNDMKSTDRVADLEAAGFQMTDEIKTYITMIAGDYRDTASYLIELIESAEEKMNKFEEPQNAST